MCANNHHFLNPQCPEGGICPEEKERDESKKMFKFQDNKFYKANRAAKSL